MSGGFRWVQIWDNCPVRHSCQGDVSWWQQQITASLMQPAYRCEEPSLSSVLQAPSLSPLIQHVTVNQVRGTPAWLSLHPQLSPSDSLLHLFHIANSPRQLLQSSEPTISRSQSLPPWECAHTLNLTIKTMTTSSTLSLNQHETNSGREIQLPQKSQRKGKEKNFKVDSHWAVSKHTFPCLSALPGSLLEWHPSNQIYVKMLLWKKTVYVHVSVCWLNQHRCVTVSICLILKYLYQRSAGQQHRVWSKQKTPSATVFTVHTDTWKSQGKMA